VDLHGRVALVTGAGRRLGRACALSLAEGGADLLLHVHTSSGEEVAREVRALGRQATILSADLSQVTAASRLSREALAVAGRVDILVNNAAVFIPTPLRRLTVQSWQEILRTNLTAPFVLALLLGRTMQAQGAGKIVQLGDGSGSRPLPGYLPYCVSKGGLHALTQVLAKALAPQVQVNSVAPGPVLPPEDYDASARCALGENTPLGRLGEAGDVARAVRFLVEAGEFVNGAAYVVDGGWLARPASGTATSL
jgi:NAD(P)-dependent dehydrogenase (short-subunit alcohol dehydrogenase family)